MVMVMVMVMIRMMMVRMMMVMMVMMMMMMMMLRTVMKRMILLMLRTMRSRGRKMMMLRRMMLMRRTDPKTEDHTLRQPAQSKCARTLHKKHSMREFPGKMPRAKTGDYTLCEPAQSTCTWTLHNDYHKVYTLNSLKLFQYSTIFNKIAMNSTWNHHNFSLNQPLIAFALSGCTACAVIHRLRDRHSILPSLVDPSIAKPTKRNLMGICGGIVRRVGGTSWNIQWMVVKSCTSW